MRYIALAFAAVLVACGSSGPTTPGQTPVASVTVSLVSQSINVGATTNASAIEYDANGASLSGRSISWSSSNTSIATIATSGLVTGVAQGSVTISGTSEGKVGFATLAVVSPVSATWSGVISTSLQSLSVTLVENSGVVNGTGLLSFSPSPLALTVTGTYTAPALTLTITSGLYPAIQLTGTISGKVLTATLTGSGFTGDAVVLTRP